MTGFMVRALRNLMNKVFPDHWTFMLGEIALWTFVIELITHVLLIPGLILALVTVHIFISFRHKHTAMPLLENSEHKIRGQTFYPYFVLKGTAWFFFILGCWRCWRRSRR
jgi:quinol---cytochrome-c reductase cytochrome b subunit